MPRGTTGQIGVLTFSTSRSNTSHLDDKRNMEHQHKGDIRPSAYPPARSCAHPSASYTTSFINMGHTCGPRPARHQGDCEGVVDVTDAWTLGHLCCFACSPVSPNRKIKFQHLARGPVRPKDRRGITKVEIVLCLSLLVSPWIDSRTRKW
ncbi:hypothetical protein ACRALDRAFT_209550 [Sodiomyces alcalophilus JCM 7366]|uniref:uncharacterized protein n=1 Tax=Sodiomyces alcalophilus JCM 7366 TaxID=591952 RepID=UPI0039B57C85